MTKAFPLPPDTVARFEMLKRLTERMDPPATAGREFSDSADERDHHTR